MCDVHVLVVSFFSKSSRNLLTFFFTEQRPREKHQSTLRLRFDQSLEVGTGTGDLGVRLLPYLDDKRKQWGTEWDFYVNSILLYEVDIRVQPLNGTE